MHRTAPATPSTYVFSFVRDPLDTALDAYLELRHLSTMRSPAYLATLLRATGRQATQGDSGEASCHGTADATRQFRNFLDSVRRREHLGGDAYHVFPQALKLDHVGYDLSGSGRQRYYDAIGRVENFETDVAGMRSMLGLAQANLTRLLTEPRLQAARRTHSRRRDTCAKIDRSDAKLMALVRELYAADYACFGL